jgi:uncharacterized BrkB/YihY/UPF0761 family membrane protein
MKTKLTPVDWPSACLLFGVLSLGLGFVTGIPAIFSGHIALNKIRANPEIGRRWMPVLGLTLGYVTTPLSLLTIYLATHIPRSG